MKKILTKKGFTLIELIVVIAILAILAAILIPSLTNYINKAEQSKNLANARSVYSEVMLVLATENPNTTVTDATTSYTLGSTSCTISVSGDVVNTVTCGTGANAQTFTP